MVDNKKSNSDSEEKRKDIVLSKIFLSLSGFSLLLATIFFIFGSIADTGPYVVSFFGLLALYVRSHKFLSVTAFSLWMLTCVAAPMYYPEAFLHWGPVALPPFIIPAIMFVMFCMGATLSIDDFKRVLKMPHAVFVGVFLTFGIMPLSGKFVAVLFHAKPEIVAGMVLVGASPSGVASNVMTFLARGNVALSVTMTACATMAAPFLTPVLTKYLAGTYVPVNIVEMMLSIVKIVIIPIGGGLIAHMFLEKMGKVHPLYSRIYGNIMKALPKLSMLAILFACAVMTANAREQLIVGTVVLSVIACVIVQNFLGLTLGYWAAKLTGLGERECRTVAIEVGLQNSGMAAALALDVLKSELASIPGVVYSSWHNVTGALVASYWSHKQDNENNH